MKTEIIYCSDPINSESADEEYAKEAKTALQLDFPYKLFSFEDLCIFGNPEASVKSVPLQNNKTEMIYRGWMMSPAAYEQFYSVLSAKGYKLINNPEQYKHCHWLPESYPVIEEKTPKSVWVPNGSELTTLNILEHLKVFHGKPVILKDYVKSQKHYWHEACFIPDSGSSQDVERVVSKFLELQENDPQGGLIFREFTEFEPAGTHKISGMPLTKEFRLFYLYNQPLSVLKYWDEGCYDTELPDPDEFNELAQNIQSNFFTMDVAKTKQGRWLIVELGDAQVAGLPKNANVNDFYAKIQRISSTAHTIPK